jgi:hypothetical protein
MLILIIKLKFQNTPVVDNTKEEDKQGNNGSLTGLAKGIINVVELVSNILNKVVEVSFLENVPQVQIEFRLQEIGLQTHGIRHVSN